jgi:hypothetical protein
VTVRNAVDQAWARGSAPRQTSISWFTNWVRIAGSEDPARDAPIVMKHWTGLVLNQLVSPDPASGPPRSSPRSSPVSSSGLIRGDHGTQFMS